MNSKSKWSCLYCLKIFKEPTLLPCFHTICGHHLNEKNVLKRNQFKCPHCDETFYINGNEFGPNRLVKDLLDDDMHLSDEEKCLKQTITSYLNEFFSKYETFIHNKNQLELECCNHFQEIRCQIDIHREEKMPKVYVLPLIHKIDAIALEMIEIVKRFDVSYLTSLNEKLAQSFLKSLEEEIQTLNETFRDPNFSLEERKHIEMKQS